MRQIVSLLVGGVALLGLLVLVSSSSAQQSEVQEPLCFPETTGLCIRGRIREFWEQHGGVAVFGYPITPQQAESLDGRMIEMQWFERYRLEIHPENAPPYDVLMGHLGSELLRQREDTLRAFSTESPQEGCRFFAETGFNVCGEIWQAWRTGGLELDGVAGFSEAESLALYGLPLTDLHEEKLSDGQHYQVQWFERVRFEVHPENPAASRVMPGLLGVEVLDLPEVLLPAQRATRTATTSTPTPTPTPRRTSAVRVSQTPEQQQTLQSFIATPTPKHKPRRRPGLPSEAQIPLSPTFTATPTNTPRSISIPTPTPTKFVIPVQQATLVAVPFDTPENGD
jgi:hypothetical protein